MSKQNSGKEFEREVKAVCDHYKARGILRAAKVDPPTVVLGGFVKHLRSPFLDFAGVWTERGGRAVMFEAKSTAKDRLPFGKGGLTDEQIDAMRLWHNAGAVVFVLWRFDGKTMLCPGTTVSKIAQDRRHLKPEDCMLVTANVVRFDFVDVMRQTWRKL